LSPRQQVPNYELQSDTARLNLLTNGGFEIWQRGNGPFTTNFAASADRWFLNASGNDTNSVSKNTANVDVGSQACAAITYTRGTGTVGGMYQLFQNDNFSFAGRTITLSARVRTSTPNAVRLAFDTEQDDWLGGTVLEAVKNRSRDAHKHDLSLSSAPPVQ